MGCFGRVYVTRTKREYRYPQMPVRGFPLHPLLHEESREDEVVVHLRE